MMFFELVGVKEVSAAWVKSVAELNIVEDLRFVILILKFRIIYKRSTYSFTRSNYPTLTSYRHAGRGVRRGSAHDMRALKDAENFSIMPIQAARTSGAFERSMCTSIRTRPAGIAKISAALTAVSSLIAVLPACNKLIALRLTPSAFARA